MLSCTAPIDSGTNSLLDLLVFGRAAANTYRARSVRTGTKAFRTIAARRRSLASRHLMPPPVASVARMSPTRFVARCRRTAAFFVPSRYWRRVCARSWRSKNAHVMSLSTINRDFQYRTNRGARAREPGRDCQGDDRFRCCTKGKSRAHLARRSSERDDVHWLKHTLHYSRRQSRRLQAVNTKPLTVDTFAPKRRTF